MAKQKYYSLSDILALDCDYNLLVGERSNGKSYAVKKHCLEDAYNKGELFVYLRRWQLETKTTDVEQYFADAPVSEITGGNFTSIVVYQSKLYFANYDENMKVVKGPQCGRVIYLSGAIHFKSQAFPNYTNVIFEEFITRNKKGQMYLGEDEPDDLLDLISTIARRRKIKVWMIGNTLTRQCPYFGMWSLKNTLNQPIGSIEEYHFTTDQEDENGNPVIVNIAVERCENSGNNGKMFFGQKAKHINEGSWESETKPKLYEPYQNFTKSYELEVDYMDLSYIVELLVHKGTGNPTVYVKPFNKKRKVDRIITREYNPSMFITNKLNDIIKPERVIRDLIILKKICYSDNLTGTEFEDLMNDFNFL